MNQLHIDDDDTVKKLVHLVKNLVTRYIFSDLETYQPITLSEQSNSKLAKIRIFVRRLQL